jgi:DNA-binding beta-propeller fold protein YncE
MRTAKTIKTWRGKTWRGKTWPGALAVPLLLATACGESGDDGAPLSDAGGYWVDAGTGLPECFSSNECPTGWTCSEFGTCVPPAPDQPDGAPPAEVEYELSRPASALRYIYVAMTELDALAKVDGQTLAVSSIEVGDQPEVVVTVPGSDAAIVLDESNGTATIVRPTVDNDQTITVATLPHLNEIAVDPTGAYAVAWFDLAKAELEAGGLDFVGDIGSFQDITVLDLTLGDERAVDLTVGFRPREVEFDDAGTHAYVVTDEGVSVIDLGAATSIGPHIVAPIPVTTDPLSDPLGIEIDVVADGSYAVVREIGLAELRVVDLAGPGVGTQWTIPLPAEPTDVDLAPAGDRAYAVLRDAAALAVVDVPADGLDPAGVELVDLTGAVVGSLRLSDDGSRGLLFTNAVDDERVTVLALGEPGYPYVTHGLQKSVRYVDFDPSGAKAIILHAKQYGDPADAVTFEQFIDRSYGYSVLDIATGFDKLQVTPVDPGSFAFVNGQPRAYLVLDGGDWEGAVARVHIIELDTGVVRERDLSSPPDTVGILPAASAAFVSQRHGLGRVSFIDLESDALRTVTGFDLNSRIVD